MKPNELNNISEGFVENYSDHAVGILGKNSEKKLAMTKITLNPKVLFTGTTIPTRDQIDELYHLAHEKCFISSSVKTEITIEQN
jgi:organic hydroperoxide reductase OsmC/OhrA